MTWLQILSIVAVMATFMGAGIAVAAYFNGKHIREGISQLVGILTDMQRTSEQTHKEVMETSDQRHKEVMETSDQRHKDTIELLKIGQRTSDQRHKDTVELLKMGFGNKSK